MRKNLFTVLIHFLCVVMVNAQEKTDVMLFGHVKSAFTKEHIPFASVGVKGTSRGTIADASGHFKLSNLPTGPHTIVVSVMGYKSQEREVMLEKGKEVVLFFELSEDVLNLEQVVVTGTRTAHYIKDVPVRTEVITAGSIQSKNATNIFQALEGVPGIRVENQCQYCNFTMVRMQGLGAEHTQVLINGQPMYSGLAGVYGLQQLSTVDIDKIEVVKGAGSALYGSGAVAGAINIVTKAPGFEPLTSLDIQFGSYGTNKYDISSSMRNEKGNVGLSLFAQRYTEGVIDQTGPGNNRKEVAKQDGVSDRVLTNLTNAGFGLYIDNIFSGNDQLVLRGKSVFEKREGGTITGDYYRNPLTDGTENITTDRYEASMTYEVKLNGSAEISLNAAYVNHSRNATNDSYLTDYMATHHDSVPDLRLMRPYLANEHTFTTTLTLVKRLPNHSFVGGFQFFYDKLEESGMYVVVDENSLFRGQSYHSVGDKRARELGAFIQDEWSIGKRLMLVPGIRLDFHQSGEAYTADQKVFVNNRFPETNFSETAVNPRVAIKYEVSKLVTLRANAGTGFRAPYGFSEDLHLCSGSPRVWKSSELKAETSVSYNLSADYYGHRLRISANVFRTKLRNKIGFTDADDEVTALGYDYQWKNIDDAFVQGVELSATANLAAKLELTVDFTLNQGKYKQLREDWIGTASEADSRYISRFPKTTANIRIEYSPGKWSLAATGNMQGVMYIDYYNEAIDPLMGDQSKIKKTSPFMIFNARASRQVGIIKLYAGVNNIFNYIQDERHLDDAAFIYAPVYGTMLYAGVNIRIQH